MVHVTDVKKITLMEQVADEYEKLGKEGRFSNKCIPQGYIPDFDWTTGVPQQIIWNQFKPALKSPKLMKILKFTASRSIFPPSNANFTKNFIFSDSSLTQDHFGTNCRKIHLLLREINIAPRK